MRPSGVRTVALAMIAAVFTACVSDQTVRLRYLPDARIERLAGAQPVTVFRFADRRGDEGQERKQKDDRADVQVRDAADQERE